VRLVVEEEREKIDSENNGLGDAGHQLRRGQTGPVANPKMSTYMCSQIIKEVHVKHLHKGRGCSLPNVEMLAGSTVWML
jgi:hypothetical protein